MTHFPVAVILPDTGKEFAKDTSMERIQEIAMASIADLIAPYDERIEVEEYDQQCWCKKVPNFNFMGVTTHGDKTAEDKMNDKGEICPSCHGKGTYPSTYNPDAKWDWWVVGGRWNGQLRGIRLKDNPSGHDDVQSNWAFCKQLAQALEERHEFGPEIQVPRTIPMIASIVTPQGDWLEQGRALMFGVCEDPMSNEEWERIMVKTLKHYSDHIAIGIDCHI